MKRLIVFVFLLLCQAILVFAEETLIVDQNYLDNPYKQQESKPEQKDQKKTNTTDLSIEELEDLISMSQKSKVVVSYDTENNEVWVDPTAWVVMNYKTRKGLAIVFSRYFNLLGSTSRVTIYDNMNGKRLADMNPWSDFTVY